MTWALVTGGSRGIGRAISIKLAKEGVNVIINYVRNDSAAEETKKICGEYSEAITFKADVSRIEDVRRMVNFLEENVGEIRYLVNNAGIFIRPGTLDLDYDSVRRIIEVNLLGPYIVTKECLRVLKEGAIVNISSIYGPIIGSPVPAYCMSKAGLIGLTKALAVALAPKIRVNAVLPGNIDTEMTRSAPREFLEKVIRETPLKRLGKPEEVAEIAYELLTNEFITGAIVVIDGGLSIV